MLAFVTRRIKSFTIGRLQLRDCEKARGNNRIAGNKISLHAAGVQTARLHSCASIDRLAMSDVFFALSSFRGRFESLSR